MSALALAAMLLVLSVQPSMPLVLIAEPVVTVVEAGNARVTTERRGATSCAATRAQDGRLLRAQVERIEAVPGSVEHELAHAASCVATGGMTGGLLPHACTWPDCEHEWVDWALAHPEQAAAIIDARRVALAASR
ncbi:MAG: hypothetical protein AB7G21_09700 [Dehalococcoidia bacterium]